ncbi:MAG: TrmH family RNA methyltransferase [Erysipelotrichaceae bacterium]|nr:TrmH family RNA methyltransferase [Erysipelotrichaceae bacterium]
MQKYRKDGEMTYALGTELTLELLKQKPQQVEAVYVHSRQLDNEICREILQLCERHRITVIHSDKAFNILNAKENCYIMGQFRKYASPLSPDENQVVLVNPGNMGNLGSIIRTMLGFGIRDLAIIRPGVDIYDPKVIRATMRAFFLLRFSYYDSFEEYRQANPGHHIYTFMLDGQTRLQDVQPGNEKYALVFGNEATGLPQQYHEYGDSVFIEQLDTIDSLNLNNAVSIAVYEFTKGHIHE